MDKRLWLTSALIVSFMCSAAMAAPVVVPADQFPNFSNGEYLQPNTVYQNSAISTNMAGVSSGQVWANAIYVDGAICEAGKFLPANTVTCVTCLENNYCTGGTFELSASDQGISQCLNGLSSPAGSTSADMCEMRNTTCEAGTYLPAHSADCEVCPENSYCGGGEFAESASDQGVSACASGLVSPEGTISAGGCGKIMRVGEDVLYLTSEKQTTPALAVKLEGKVYYAKMTPGDVAVSAESTQSLRTRVDGVEYSIHDNTVTPQDTSQIGQR